MELLRNVTTEQLLNYLDDDYFRELIAEEILKLAKHYLRTYPIIGVEYEDCVQSLFMRVWEHIYEFDNTRGGFATFAYLWFRGERQCLIKPLKHRTLSLDIPFECESGDLNYLELIQDSNKTALDKMLYEETLELCGEELKLWLGGYTQEEISRTVGCSQPQVSRRIKANLEELRTIIGK